MSHLDEEKRLQQEVEQHVSDDFADAGEGVRLPARHFKRQIRDVLPAEMGLRQMELQSNGDFRDVKPTMMLLSCFCPSGIGSEPILGWDFIW